MSPPRFAHVADAPQFARVEVLEERTANLQRLLDEIDRRYVERFDAVAATIAGQKEATALALAAQQKATETAMVAAEKAVAKAETAAEKRFEGVNEFRAQLSDQAATFVGRAEYAATTKATNDKIDEIKGRVDALGGRSAGFSAGWAVLVGAVGIALAIYAALRPH